MGLVLKELMAIVVNFPHQEKESFIAQKEGYQKNRPRKKGNMSCLRVQGKSDNYPFRSTICLLKYYYIPLPSYYVFFILSCFIYIVMTTRKIIVSKTTKTEKMRIHLILESTMMTGMLRNDEIVTEFETNSF